LEKIPLESLYQDTINQINEEAKNENIGQRGRQRQMSEDSVVSRRNEDYQLNYQDRVTCIGDHAASYCESLE
jgi:hypothetical protein